MVENKATDRLEFLAQKFNVFETEKDSYAEKIGEIEATGYVITYRLQNKKDILALV